MSVHAREELGTFLDGHSPVVLRELKARLGWEGLTEQVAFESNKWEFVWKTGEGGAIFVKRNRLCKERGPWGVTGIRPERLSSWNWF